MTDTRDARATVSPHSLSPRTTSIDNPVIEKEQYRALMVILVIHGRNGPERFIPAEGTIELLPGHCPVAWHGNEHNQQAGTPTRGSGPGHNLLDVEELERQLRWLLIDSPSGPRPGQGGHRRQLCQINQVVTGSDSTVHACCKHNATDQESTRTRNSYP